MSDSSINIIFLGTPDFSVPTLQHLLSTSEINILGVITQPDQPAGRGQQLTPPPVKVVATQAGLPVFQPKSLRKDTELQTWMREQQPDILVTIAFGQILSQDVLDIPRLGTVNVHASLLPKLRGANPIQQAILQGDTETGITTMLTDIGVDTGDMLLKQVVPIGPNTTYGELYQQLSTMGGPLLVETLNGLANGSLKPTAQKHDEATHAPKTDKSKAQIHWDNPAQLIHNQIRGCNPFPGAFSLLDNQRVKLLKSVMPDNQSILPELPAMQPVPGQLLGTTPSGLWINTGSGLLALTEVQPAGKKPMSAIDWYRGLRLNTDELVQFDQPTMVC